MLTPVKPHAGTYVISRLGRYVGSRSDLVLLDAWPGLDVGAFFDGEHFVFGGVKVHCPDEPGGVELLVAGLLELEHNVVDVGPSRHQPSS